MEEEVCTKNYMNFASTKRKRKENKLHTHLQFAASCDSKELIFYSKIVYK